ncbi:hypothetical protein ACE3NQ_16130 [Paenibacillus terreus]|uniref:Uncharacterized protein n=1 Tax=Paenibacillus terreus TaxID=1387834 RepID=A0ABV5BA20_9BACL
MAPNSEEQRKLQRIVRESGLDSLLSVLTETMSSSDLNTLLLEVFRERIRASTASDLLRRYESNRFVHPAAMNPIEMKRLEIDILQIADNHAFSPIQLSPVAPLGSCSIVAPADQNKVISALRGTEVVADATNLLALHICDLVKSGRASNEDNFIRLSTTHRHVRAQHFDTPGMFPHFHVFCMITSGKDKGSYSFEKQAIWEHIHVYQDIFKLLCNSEIEIVLNVRRSGYKDPEGLIQRVMQYGEQSSVRVSASESTGKEDNSYYKGLQFTIMVNIKGQHIPIGDGGFVDWPQQLLNNRKERMLISAIGLDIMLLNGFL